MSFLWSCALMAVVPTGAVAQEMPAADQYDGLADTFSEVCLERNRENAAAFFKRIAPSLKGKNVLDLGCGTGCDLAEMQARGACVFGIDASAEMVRMAKRALPDGEIVIGLFEHIPFPDSTFDLVISKWALQNAPEIDPVYSEIARVLKPGGELLYLASHPIRQFMEKKRKGKNYFQKEIIESVFFGGQITAREPSHTMNEYLSPIFFDKFSLEVFEEAFDAEAEQVDGDIYPIYFILKAQRKKGL